MFKLKALLIATAIMLTTDVNANADIKIVDRVVAVVDNAVITKQDLDKRFQLSLRQMNNNLPKNQQKQLYAKTLGSLINEKLQNEYANQLGLKASKNEINMAISQIELNNKLPHGSFMKMAKGIEDTAISQIESEILWKKIVDKHVAPRVLVSNDELDQLIDNLLANNEVTEKEVSLISIIAKNKADETRAKNTVNSIYNKLKNGEDFASLAKALSEDSSSASKGGYIGWFGPNELSPELDKILSSVNKGDLSKPVRTASGWHIIKVVNTRSNKKFSTDPITEYNFIRLSALLSDNKNESKKIAKQFKKYVSDIDNKSDIQSIIKEIQGNSDFSNSEDMGWVKEEDLSSNYLKAAKSLDKNELSDVIITDTSMEVLFLANKREVIPEKLKQYRDRVRQRVTSNRVGLASRRFMRNLRRNAYIDIKL